MAADRHQPAPPGASPEELPPELGALVERLAERVHDAWARQRLADGWRWGPERDDASRRHPSLVPYAELPDEERRYDRVTVEETLRALLALGFRVTGPGPGGKGSP